MSLVKCHECGSEISSAATSCPKCGAPTKLSTDTHKQSTTPASQAINTRLQDALWRVARKAGAILFIGVCALVYVAYLTVKGPSSTGAPANSSSHSAALSNANSSDEPKLFNIGDTIKTKKFEITILSVKTLDAISDPLGGPDKPADGGVYVAVYWKYKNISDKPIGPFSTPSLKLLDKANTEYDTDTGASADYAATVKDTEKVLSDINPGITVSTGDVFEVSKSLFNPKTWKLKVSADSDVYYSLTTQKTSTAKENPQQPSSSSPSAQTSPLQSAQSQQTTNKAPLSTAPSATAQQSPSNTPRPSHTPTQPQSNAAFLCITKKYTILIDAPSKSDQYRYRSWNKPLNTNQPPSYTLHNGTLDVEGTGSCQSQTYTFTKGNLQITVDDAINCTESAPPSGAIGNLSVFIGGKLKAHEFCFKQ